MEKGCIAAEQAMEIPDSRENPAVRVFLDLDDGTSISASAPSGAAASVRLPIYQQLGGAGDMEWNRIS